MSAGKRLAKRSIVGTRVCGPLKETGFYHPGVIINSKNLDELSFNHCNTGITPNSRYVVRFESGDTREFSESELIGPGFGGVNSLKLRSGQKIFVTHNGREVCGTVVYHRPNIDEVLISILPQSPNETQFDVTKKLDEVRLMESRKSARLQEQDFDFARLADVADRKRNQQTASIDVPRSNNMSRKRRPSSGNIFQPVVSMQGGEADGMDECSAAMVLMSLSCSPHSPRCWEENNGMISSSWSSSYSGASSWLSAAQVGSFGGAGPASGCGSSGSSGEHFNNYSPTPSSSDDGIESDNGEWEEPRKKKTRIIFKCTFPECNQLKDTEFEIEAHVRYAHLGPKQDYSEGADAHEEDFYITEVEVTDLSLSSSSFGGSSSGISMAFSPTLSHLDMARPPSEDPEYKVHMQQQRKSPSGNTHLNPKKRLSPKNSPVRKPRGDTKKCRKVYGMERRDAWCTQCKWKKACTRYTD